MAAASIASWKRSSSWALADVRPAFAVTCAGMSRHHTTVSCGGRSAIDEPFERRCKLAVPGPAPLEGDAEIVGRCPRAFRKTVVVGLREVEHALVVPED